MKVETATVEAFKAIPVRNTILTEEVTAMKERLTSPDKVIRFRDHEHIPLGGAARVCRLYQRLKMGASRKGWKIKIAHDGDDLLVMRVS